MRVKFSLAILAVSALAGCAPPAAQAQAAGLPNGHYACGQNVGGSFSTFGYVDIRGSTYRGPSLDGAGLFAPYSVGPDGAIQWSGSFGAFNTNGAHIVGSSVMAGDKPWFRVNYVSAGGDPEQLDCTPE